MTICVRTSLRSPRRDDEHKRRAVTRAVGPRHSRSKPVCPESSWIDPWSGSPRERVRFALHVRGATCIASMTICVRTSARCDHRESRAAGAMPIVARRTRGVMRPGVQLERVTPGWDSDTRTQRVPAGTQTGQTFRGNANRTRIIQLDSGQTGRLRPCAASPRDARVRRLVEVTCVR